MNDTQVLRVDTTDFDELAATLTRWNQEYRQLSAGPFHGSLRYLGIAGVELFRVQWDQVIQYRGLPPSGSAGFAIPVRFSGKARWLGQPLAADAMVAQINGEEAELIGAHQSDIAVVTLPRLEFARRFTLGTGVPLDDTAGRLKYFPNGGVRVQRLRQYLAEFFRYLEQAPLPQLAQAIERQVLDTVLATAVEVFAEHLPAASDDGPCARHRQTVVLAETYCLESPGRPVTVTELCAALGVSERTLCNAFHEQKGLSPTQYLKAIRLNEVRRRLLCAEPNTTRIQDLAADWGFWHMGHFGADYKRLFGETPSQTLTARVRRRYNSSSLARQEELQGH